MEPDMPGCMFTSCLSGHDVWVARLRFTGWGDDTARVELNAGVHVLHSECSITREAVAADPPSQCEYLVEDDGQVDELA